MAKIARQTHKVFGGSGSSDNFAKFGSLVAAAPVKTKDIATIQALPAWDNGFQDSIFGANKDLLLEDVNSFAYEHSTQIAYLFQAGIAEWDSGTTYYSGSLVQATDGSGDVYVSLQDNNAGNAIPGHAGNAWWSWWNPSGSGSGLNADMVDGYHASGTPVAGKLLALDGSGQFPASVFQNAVIQSVRSEDASFQSLANVIPADDTIPQVGEGTQILTLTLTPKSATSKLRIFVVVPMGVPYSAPYTVALFRDGAADAIGALCQQPETNGGMYEAVFDCEVNANAAIATTFTVRAGPTTGQAPITTNGGGEFAGRVMGGVMKMSMRIDEIAA